MMDYDDHIYGEPAENFEREESAPDFVTYACAVGDHDDCGRGIHIGTLALECECGCHA